MEFREAGKQFLEETLNLLQRKATTEGTPKERIKKIERSGSGWKYDYEIVSSLDRLVFIHREKIYNLDSTKKFIEAAKNVDLFSQEGKGFKQVIIDERTFEHFFIGYYIHNLVEKYLQRTNNLNFDFDVFNEIFDNMMSWIEETTVNISYIAPLFNFVSEELEIKLGEFTIEKITDKDKVALHQEADQFLIIPIAKTFLDADCILKVVRTERKFWPDAAPVSDFKDIETCLRLFKEGAVYIPRIYSKSSEWGPTRGYGCSSVNFQDLDGMKYQIKMGEGHQIETFWNEVKDIISEPPKILQIALKRFNDSYNKNKKEDKLIDYMVALESLLLREDSELTYKMAMRGAYLLGRNFHERRELFETIKKAYSLRSKIVHGNTLKDSVKVLNEEYSLDDFLARVEDITRRTIVKFCEKFVSVSKKQVPTLLDNLILTGENRIDK